VILELYFENSTFGVITR